MMSIWCAVRGFVAQGLTAVVGKEVVVNAFAAAEAFVDAVPEADGVFAEFPAQADVAALVAGHEIEQADVEFATGDVEAQKLLGISLEGSVG